MNKPQTEAGNKAYQVGMDALIAKRYPEAMEAFQRLTEVEPTYLEGFFILAGIAATIKDQRYEEKIIAAIWKRKDEFMSFLFPHGGITPLQGKKAAFRKMANNPSDVCYQLKISMLNIKPPIWRRVLVESDISLAMLHRIIQTVMDWKDSHLHEFTTPDQRTFIWKTGHLKEFYRGGELQDEQQVKLNNVLTKEKDRLLYTYDFGENWEHVILLEKILPREEGKFYPICLKGKRAAPPEDSGGPLGYEGYLEALADPDNEEHEALLEYWGGLESETFDLAAINRALHLLH